MSFVRNRSDASKERRRILAAAGAAIVATTAGVSLAAGSGREVILGLSGTLSGPYATGVLGFKAGAELLIDYVNANGGVAGRQIKLVPLDDGLKPERAAANFEKLVTDYKVHAFFGAGGTPSAAAAISVARKTGLPLIGNYAFADTVRASAAGAGYFVRASYGREAERVIEHLGSVGMSRIAVAYMAMPTGEAFLELVRNKILASPDKVQLVASAPIRFEDVELKETVALLTRAAPQAVILFLSGAVSTPALVRKLSQAGVFPGYYGISTVSCDAVARDLGNDLKGLTACQVVPSPWSKSDPTAVEFQKRAAEKKLPVNYQTYEGYVNALFLVDVLRRADADISREGLHRVLRSYSNRLAGIHLDFTTGSASGGRYVDLVLARGDGTFVR